MIESTSSWSITCDDLHSPRWWWLQVQNIDEIFRWLNHVNHVNVGSWRLRRTRANLPEEPNEEIVDIALVRNLITPSTLALVCKAMYPWSIPFIFTPSSWPSKRTSGVCWMWSFGESSSESSFDFSKVGRRYLWHEQSSTPGTADGHDLYALFSIVGAPMNLASLQFQDIS